MKVLLVWTGGAVPAYREFLSELGMRCRLRVLAPRRWVHGSMAFRAGDTPAHDFDLLIRPFRRLGSSFYFVPAFVWELLWRPPDAIYFMDEADRPATTVHLGLALLLRPRARRVNYNLQNLAAPAAQLARHRLCLRLNRALLHGLIACGAEAESVLRGHGFRQPAARIPLFASESVFHPASPVAKGNLRRRLGVPDGRVVLVYAGSLSPAKGVDLLLETVQRLPGLFLILAGRGELETRARALPSDRGVYLGPLPLERLREAYQCGDCVILPSRDTAAWKEQVGRTLLEGILCGCLGLGSDGGFIAELLGTPETVFRQGDAEALAALLARLPLPHAHRLHQRQLARVRERFSARKVAEDTAAFLAAPAARDEAQRPA